MAHDRGKLEKVIALAIHPTTVQAEALAAFNRAREIVKLNPILAHPPALEAADVQPDYPAFEFTATITNLPQDWILAFVSLMSKSGYEAGVRYRIDFDLNQEPVAIKIQCKGDEVDCNLFEDDVAWCVNYINDQARTQY